MKAPFKAFDIGTVSLVRCNATTVRLYTHGREMFRNLVHCSYDIYRLRVTFIVLLYTFSLHPTVKVKVNATFPVHLSREHLICSSRHKREPF